MCELLVFSFPSGMWGVDNSVHGTDRPGVHRSDWSSDVIHRTNHHRPLHYAHRHLALPCGFRDVTTPVGSRATVRHTSPW